MVDAVPCGVVSGKRAGSIPALSHECSSTLLGCRDCGRKSWFDSGLCESTDLFGTRDMAGRKDGHF